MKKIFSFMAGALCGLLVGGVAVILLTPKSGEQLRNDVQERWQTAVEEARRAREEKLRELQEQFEAAKRM